MDLRRGLSIGALATLLATGAVSADATALQPAADNTIYEEGDTVSNGSGQHVFAGTAAAFAPPRRALLRFDVATAVPPGSTVTAVVLSLRLSRTASLNQPVSAHRLLASWGEAGSDANGMEGTGTVAQPGDATWGFREWSTLAWAVPGGDFFSPASATTTIGGPCLPENAQTAACIKYSWSSPAMVADVQSWIDQPSTNFGWIMLGNESTAGSAKRFDSRESATSANRPQLRVIFDPPSAASGSVPDGNLTPGTPLELTRIDPGQLQLDWDPSCVAGDTDYEIYDGTIGNYYDHQSAVCSTGGATSWNLPLPAGSRYYLIVPTDGSVEGGYGRDSLGTPRPAAGAGCRPLTSGDCSGR